MRPLHGFICLALLVSLAGCGSTPQSNYYLLSSPVSTLPVGTEPSLGIGPITMPEYLNRNSMVFLSGDNELEIASFERWAEPLGDGIQRTLALNLASMLDTQNVRAFPWARSRAPEYAVRLRIVGLDAGRGKASLVSEWVLLSGEEPGAEVTRRLSRIDASLPGDRPRGDAVASAYSDLLYQLSEEIAGAIREAMAEAEG